MFSLICLVFAFVCAFIAGVFREPVEPHRTRLIAIALAFFFISMIFNNAEITKFFHTQRDTMPKSLQKVFWTGHEDDLANSYFRMGEQAALFAIGRQDSDERIWNPIMCIDDSRIFDAVRALNNGNTIGLDTSDWSGFYSSTEHRAPHTLTVLDRK